MDTNRVSLYNMVVQLAVFQGIFRHLLLLEKFVTGPGPNDQVLYNLLKRALAI